MVKFHGSGREDLNVRMLLYPTHNKEQWKETGGRPFVCEVIDARCMPSSQDLEKVVTAVNRSQEMINEEQRCFGQNPNGVGISELSFCPAKAFSNLQADTEDKVKCYGCLCWIEREIVQEGNDLKLTLGKLTFPLELQQSTPIRVLHRRSAAVRVRHVLSLHVSEVVDEHHVRLHLSTSAGTYVKEFVHGDLGRTTPNLSTILGCKTDILELDCEGIDTSSFKNKDVDTKT